MIVASFFLPLELPAFNELEAARGKVAAARGTGDSTRQNAYNALKRKAQADCVIHFFAGGARRTTIPAGARVRVRFVWHCADRRHDPDNVAAAKKIIMDALARTRGDSVGAGVLHCDGWHCVAGFSDDFVSEAHRGRVGVHVALEAVSE